MMNTSFPCWLVFLCCRPWTFPRDNNGWDTCNWGWSNSPLFLMSCLMRSACVIGNKNDELEPIRGAHSALLFFARARAGILFCCCLLSVFSAPLSISYITTQKQKRKGGKTGKVEKGDKNNHFRHKSFKALIEFQIWIIYWLKNWKLVFKFWNSFIKKLLKNYFDKTV